jgi:hypothetical protein
MQRLLRLQIFNKTRFVAFHVKYDKEATIAVFTSFGEMRVLMTLILCSLWSKTFSCYVLATKLMMLSTDVLTPLSESTSLSQLVNIFVSYFLPIFL